MQLSPATGLYGILFSASKIQESIRDICMQHLFDTRMIDPQIIDIDMIDYIDLTIDQIQIKIKIMIQIY